MILKNSLIYINQFFFFIFSELRKIYLKSNIYNKKISKINSNHLDYKPSPSLLDGIIKYSKSKKNIQDFSLKNIWSDERIIKKDFRKLHSFSGYLALISILLKKMYKTFCGTGLKKIKTIMLIAGKQIYYLKGLYPGYQILKLHMKIAMKFLKMSLII